MKLGLIILGCGVFLVFIRMFLPLYLKQTKDEGLWEAVHHARHIGLGLYEFDMEYGAFPNSSTASAVLDRSGSKLRLPDRTANDLFAQLIVSKIFSGEEMFYAKAKSAQKPDNFFDTQSNILEPGECAFAYISGLSSKSDQTTPIVFGPVIPGTKTLSTKCSGMAVVLRIDNSVSRIPITADGKIIINGLDILDPRQPFWNGKAPDVKWPK